MLTAPVSPIATQETVEEIAREKLAAWMIAHSIATGHGDTFDDLLGELSVALSSAERRIEELGRSVEDKAKEIALVWPTHEHAEDPVYRVTFLLEELHGRAIYAKSDAEALVTTLKAEVEELKRRAAILAATIDTFVRAQDHYREAMDERNTLKNAARAAESRLASLTGQVEGMRERAAKVADEWGWSSKPDHAHGIRDAIRSLPVLPTTGDGGGWRSMDSAPKDGTQVMIFCPSYYQGKGGVSWGVFVGGRWMDSRAFVTEPTHWMPLPQAPTGRETSGEET